MFLFCYQPSKLNMKIRQINYQNKHCVQHLNLMKYLKFHLKLVKNFVLDQSKIVTLIGSSQAFNLQDLEKLMEDNRSLQASYQKCKESLQALNSELDKIMNDPQVLSETDKIKHQNLITKYKQANDENKRLRQHLKQLNEDFCKQRIQTQTTFDFLREEIDLLVKELAPFQQQKKQNDILISN
ncbi:unnamed protein product [Paramecium sonneborni]|uniref:Uncharacterized protein n=1 Tax=Paramecium sonneborni TaxID=65129 RepID=A0A8S1RA12_9CILI|nr:unnamed protein product [Paramecium sonneborni]